MSRAEASVTEYEVMPGDIQEAYEMFRKESKDQDQIDSRRRLEEKLEQRRLERELKEFDFSF